MAEGRPKRVRTLTEKGAEYSRPSKVPAGQNLTHFRNINSKIFLGVKATIPPHESAPHDLGDDPETGDLRTVDTDDTRKVSDGQSVHSF